MRFPNKNFILNVNFAHSSNLTKLEIYDDNLNTLAYDDNQVLINLPCKIILRLVDVKESELLNVSLAGIKFKQENLLSILEYKVCKYKLQSLADLDKFPSTRSTKCNNDGYYIINLFNRNPFAIHLFVGNTINFKL